MEDGHEANENGPLEAKASRWKHTPLKYLGNTLLQFFGSKPIGNKR